MRKLWIVWMGLGLAGAASAEEAKGSISGKVTSPGASQVVVYIEKVPKAVPRPVNDKPMTQKNSAFMPEMLVVTVGSSVSFPNEDKVFHNVFSVTPGNEFDLGLYRGGASKAVDFKEAGEVDVFCNIHPNMAAKLLVLQNDFYVTVEKDGSFNLANVPPGAFTLVAWSAETTLEKVKIEIKPGANATASFTLKPLPGIKMHTNKNGEQYGRYK